MPLACRGWPADGRAPAEQRPRRRDPRIARGEILNKTWSFSSDCGNCPSRLAVGNSARRQGFGARCPTTGEGTTLRFRLLGLLVPLAVLSTVLAATAFSTNTVKNGGTVVFGAAADPVSLDGSIVSDGESLRPINQIFEGLVGPQDRLDLAHAAAGHQLVGEQERPVVDVQSPQGRLVLGRARRSTRQRSVTTSTAGTTSRIRCRTRVFRTTGTPCSAGSPIRARVTRGRTRASTRAARRSASTRPSSA